MSERTYSEIVDEIKNRLDILEVVQNRVVLKKSGANYWGCCPFHKEKTPSFSVNPQKGIYKCFGCGEGGDAISFIMKTNNQSFNETIKDLAESFGIELPKSYGSSKDSADKKDKIKQALQSAAKIYTENLLTRPDAKPALDYLTKRGISEETIKEYQLGYSAKGYNSLQEELGKKFDNDILEAAGLIIKREQEKGYVDRFRNRIMIPIFDESATIVAFGARATEEGQNPKYLNSPDTVLYNKSRILYGIHVAKDTIKEEDATIIMEGYFDVISAQAAGLKNCVASCGTSLTTEHIKLIAKYSQSRHIYLAFDGDSAGKKATERGAETIKEVFSGLGNIKQFDENYSSMSQGKYSCEIRVVAPLGGKDPDEYIREFGIESYKQHVISAPLLIDYQLNQVLKEKKENSNPIEKAKLVRKIIPILEEIENNIVQNEYIKLVSARLAVDEMALSREITKGKSVKTAPIEIKNQIVTKTSNISEKGQKNLLSLYLIDESHLDFSTLSNIIKNVKFDNEKLNVLRITIDKLICQVNNVEKLIGALYTQFAENDEIKEIITDLIYLSESFKNLSEKDFKAVIYENMQKIEQFHSIQEKKELRQKYKQLSYDDLESMQYQMQLREKIRNKLAKTGE